MSFFSDGKQLTATDVVFTYQKFADPTIASGEQSLVQNMTVSALNNNTVQFVFTHAYPAFDVIAGWFGILPQHLLANVPDSAMQNSTFNSAPVGSGPYKFVSRVPGASITLVANENYFKGSPHIKNITIRLIEDSAAMITAVSSNQIDLLVSEAFPGGLAYQNVQQANHSGYYTQTYGGFPMVFYMGLRIRSHGIIRWLEQAILYSINRTELIEKFLGPIGVGGILWNDRFTTPWAANPNIVPYTYNTTKAEQLLTEAGYPAGSNGTRFSTTVYATTGERTLFSQLIASMLAQVGIHATVVSTDFNTYINMLQVTRQWNGIATIFQYIDS